MTAQVKRIRFSVVIMALAAAFLVLFGSIGITSAAAQSSIPGDALYPVKTTIERTRLSLAQDAGMRAQMKMDFAQERLKEIDALIKEGRFREVNDVVLEFEANINSALMELEILSKVDPARAGDLALKITETLSRYAKTLSALLESVPEDVRAEVSRALDTTRVVGAMEMPAGNENANSNGNDDDSNGNGDDSNANGNGNDDDSNTNGDDSNANGNGNDDDSNGNGDDSNANGNDDDSNTNGDDSNANGNDDDSNTNGDDSNANDNGNDDDSNTNGDDSNSNDGDSGSDDSNTNSNTNGGDDANSNADDSGGSDNNGNGSGDGGGSGKGKDDNGDD